MGNNTQVSVPKVKGPAWPRVRRPFMVIWAITALMLFNSQGCGLFTTPYKPAFLETKTLTLYPDRVFNQGLALPLDICFVTIKGNPKEVTSVSPEDWFLKNKRDEYPDKQSLSITPGNTTPLRVTLTPPAETQSLVLVTNYINLKGGKGQQLAISAPGKLEEAVFVTDKGIYR